MKVKEIRKVGQLINLTYSIVTGSFKKVLIVEIY